MDKTKTFLDNETLIIAVLTGVATPEEKEHLAALIETDPQVYAMLEEIKKLVEEVSTCSDEYVRQKVAEIIHKHDRFGPIREISYVACIAASILLACFLVIRPRSHENTRPFSDNNVDKQKYTILEFNGKRSLLNGESFIAFEDGKIVTDGCDTLNLTHKGSHQINDGKITGIGQLPDESDTVSVNIPGGKRYKVELYDGTKIELDSNSHVRFPARFGANREIIVEGQVYIETGHRLSKPLFVYVQGLKLQPFGTSFNVNSSKPGEVTVALTSGSVRVTDGKSEVLVDSGYKARYSEQRFETLPLDKDVTLEWLNREGVIYLEADEKALVAAVAKYFKKRIIFRRPFNGPALIPLDPNGSVEKFLEVIPGKYDYSIAGDTIYLK